MSHVFRIWDMKKKRMIYLEKDRITCEMFRNKDRYKLTLEKVGLVSKRC